MWWQYTGTDLKSDAEMQRLVDDVILDPDFDKEELRGFSVEREKARLDKFNEEGGDSFTPETGWQEMTVNLKLPRAKTRYANEDDIPIATVSGIWVRDLLQTLVAGCEEDIASQFHWCPSALGRDAGPGRPAERMYTDFYNSTAFLVEHAKIQSRPRDPQDPPDLEYAVVPILIHSDSTRLAQFGEASLWPIYLWFLCLSKYVRDRPAAFATMHLAYVPHVRIRPPSFIACLLTMCPAREIGIQQI